MRNSRALISVAMLFVAGFAAAHEGKLASADLMAIEATLTGFRDAWFRNDADQVMRRLTPDAVIMPHHGVRPRVGAGEIRAFWWPANSPPAKVTRFEQSHEEIGGDGDLAYVRGRSTVEYEWGQPGQERRYRNVGTTLTLLRRSGGQWKISHRMWDDPPTEDLGPVTR